MTQTSQDNRHPAAAMPVDRLKAEIRNLAGALGERALGSLVAKVGDSAGRLRDYAEGGAGPGLAAAFTGVQKLAEGESPGKAAVGAGMKAAKQAVGGLFGRRGGGGQGKKLKVT